MRLRGDVPGDLASRLSVHPAGAGSFAVSLDGEQVGVVERGVRLWERGPKSYRYVTVRGETPCWWVISGGHSRRIAFNSLTDAAVDIARATERRQ